MLTFHRCTFESCRFIGARLNGITFKDCAFLSCAFRDTVLFAVKFEDCKMTGSDFSMSDCSSMCLEGGDWSYTNLRYQVFDKQKLTGIHFFGADLTGCRFQKCAMQGCTFSECTMHETSLEGSDIRGASLANTDLIGVDLKDAMLDLEQCVYIAETLTHGKYSPKNPKLSHSPLEQPWL